MVVVEQSAVVHGSVEAGTTHITETVRQQQTGVIIPPPALPSKPNQGCDCSIPPDASQIMTVTRCLSVAVIVAHVVALFALGFFSPAQWVASLCGVICGAVLLCCYSKCIYTCTPIFYIFVAVSDIGAVLWWVFIWNGVSIAMLVFPAIAFMVTVPAIIVGFVACSRWDTAAGTIVGPQAPMVAVVNAPPPVVVRDNPQAYLQA